MAVLWAGRHVRLWCMRDLTTVTHNRQGKKHVLSARALRLCRVHLLLYVAFKTHIPKDKLSLALCLSISLSLL